MSIERRTWSASGDMIAFAVGPKSGSVQIASEARNTTAAPIVLTGGDATPRSGLRTSD